VYDESGALRLGELDRPRRRILNDNEYSPTPPWSLLKRVIQEAAKNLKMIPILRKQKKWLAVLMAGSLGRRKTQSEYFGHGSYG
jgi:hypothetical protein